MGDQDLPPAQCFLAADLGSPRRSVIRRQCKKHQSARPVSLCLHRLSAHMGASSRVVHMGPVTSNWNVTAINPGKYPCFNGHNDKLLQIHVLTGNKEDVISQ